MYWIRHRLGLSTPSVYGSVAVWPRHCHQLVGKSRATMAWSGVFECRLPSRALLDECHLGGRSDGFSVTEGVDWQVTECELVMAPFLFIEVVTTNLAVAVTEVQCDIGLLSTAVVSADQSLNERCLPFEPGGVLLIDYPTREPSIGSRSRNERLLSDVWSSEALRIREPRQVKVNHRPFHRSSIWSKLCRPGHFAFRPVNWWRAFPVFEVKFVFSCSARHHVHHLVGAFADSAAASRTRGQSSIPFLGLLSTLVYHSSGAWWNPVNFGCRHDYCLRLPWSVHAICRRTRVR